MGNKQYEFINTNHARQTKALSFDRITKLADEEYTVNNPWSGSQLSIVETRIKNYKFRCARFYNFSCLKQFGLKLFLKFKTKVCIYCLLLFSSGSIKSVETVGITSFAGRWQQEGELQSGQQTGVWVRQRRGLLQQIYDRKEGRWEGRGQEQRRLLGVGEEVDANREGTAWSKGGQQRRDYCRGLEEYGIWCSP